MDVEMLFVRPHSPVWARLEPVLIYGIGLAGGAALLAVLPPLPLWDAVPPLRLGGLTLSAPALLHLLGGAALFFDAMARGPRIVAAFEAVHARDGLPVRLITDGDYAQVRHPFYAACMLTAIGWGLSFASLYPLLLAGLACAVLVYNGRYDERRWLYPRFGEQYAAYARRVPYRYFTPVWQALLMGILMTCVIGLLL